MAQPVDAFALWTVYHLLFPCLSLLTHEKGICIRQARFFSQYSLESQNKEYLCLLGIFLYPCTFNTHVQYIHVQYVHVQYVRSRSLRTFSTFTSTRSCSVRTFTMFTYVCVSVKGGQVYLLEHD